MAVEPVIQPAPVPEETRLELVERRIDQALAQLAAIKETIATMGDLERRVAQLNDVLAHLEERATDPHGVNLGKPT